MGFLRSALHLIDFFAWPLLALGYPICASIRAIETGSKYHMRKLVIYWTIFSFISLFELLFEKLIQWVPLWPYIKLITISWLVIPQFNGACYLYQNLIHPCFLMKLHDVITQFYGSCYVYQRLLYFSLSVKLQTVTNWFNKPMEDPSLKNETYLTVAEMFLEENGSDALEKLINNKSKDYSLNDRAKEIETTNTSDKAGMLTPSQTVLDRGDSVWEDIKVMDHMIKHETTEANQVKSGKENLIQIEKKTTRMQVKEMVVPADTQVQTEWTCSLCQVTATSENMLRSHLNGSRHKAKCKGPETCKQMAKSEGIPSLTTKSIQLNQEHTKYAATVQPEKSTYAAAPKHEDKSVKKSSVLIDKKTTSVHVNNIELPAATKQIKLPETNSSKQVQKEWTCAVCQVTTTSEHDLKCHLLGKRHREKCEELKTYKKMTKTEKSLPCTSNAADPLKQEQVKHGLAARRMQTTNTNRSPKEKEKQKQVKNAGAAAPDAKLWCSFCNISCPCEIAMILHLNGRKHLARLQ